MKKQHFLYLPLLALLTILANACSNKSNYTDSIPASATEVASINLKSLADKAGAEEKENQQAIQQFLNSIKGEMSAATFQQMEEIIKDPSQSGIDFTAPLYLFNDSVYSKGAFVAKVSDENKLRSFLEAAQKEQLTTEIAEGDGYSYTTLNGDVLVAFNASVLMATNYNGKNKLEQAKQAVAVSLQQPKEKSFSSGTLFKKMQNMSGDLKMAFSSNSLLQMYGTSGVIPTLKNPEILKETKMLASLSFEKGSINVEIENHTENEEVKQLMEKYINCFPPIRNTFLEYFPESTLALFSTGINGEKLYNLIQENEDIQSNLSSKETEELKEILGLFEGDFSIGLTNITLNKAPAFLAYATLKDAGTLDKLYENKEQEAGKLMKKVVKLEEGTYVYKDRKTNIFFGQRDKQLYATNDETLYKSICKAADPSASRTNYAGNLKGNQTAFVVNTEAILNLPVVKMLMAFGGKQVAIYHSFASQVSYLQATGKGSNLSIVMQLKNKEENALKQIVTLVRDNLSPAN